MPRRPSCIDCNGPISTVQGGFSHDRCLKCLFEANRDHFLLEQNESDCTTCTSMSHRTFTENRRRSIATITMESSELFSENQAKQMDATRKSRGILSFLQLWRKALPPFALSEDEGSVSVGASHRGTSDRDFESPSRNAADGGPISLNASHSDLETVASGPKNPGSVSTPNQDAQVVIDLDLAADLVGVDSIKAIVPKVGEGLDGGGSPRSPLSRPPPGSAPASPIDLLGALSTQGHYAVGNWLRSVRSPGIGGLDLEEFPPLSALSKLSSGDVDGLLPEPSFVGAEGTDPKAAPGTGKAVESSSQRGSTHNSPRVSVRSESSQQATLAATQEQVAKDSGKVPSVHSASSQQRDRERAQLASCQHELAERTEAKRVRKQKPRIAPAMETPFSLSLAERARQEIWDAANHPLADRVGAKPPVAHLATKLSTCTEAPLDLSSAGVATGTPLRKTALPLAGVVPDTPLLEAPPNAALPLAGVVLDTPLLEALPNASLPLAGVVPDTPLLEAPPNAALPLAGVVPDTPLLEVPPNAALPLAGVVPDSPLLEASQNFHKAPPRYDPPLSTAVRTAKAALRRAVKRKAIAFAAAASTATYASATAEANRRQSAALTASIDAKAAAYTASHERQSAAASFANTAANAASYASATAAANRRQLAAPPATYAASYATATAATNRRQSAAALPPCEREEVQRHGYAAYRKLHCADASDKSQEAPSAALGVAPQKRVPPLPVSLALDLAGGSTTPVVQGGTAAQATLSFSSFCCFVKTTRPCLKAPVKRWHPPHGRALPASEPPSRDGRRLRPGASTRMLHQRLEQVVPKF